MTSALNARSSICAVRRPTTLREDDRATFTRSCHCTWCWDRNDCPCPRIYVLRLDSEPKDARRTQKRVKDCATKSCHRSPYLNISAATPFGWRLSSIFMLVLSRLICGDQSGVIAEDLHPSFGVIGRLPRVIRNESLRYCDWVISGNVSRGLSSCRQSRYRSRHL